MNGRNPRSPFQTRYSFSIILYLGNVHQISSLLEYVINTYPAAYNVKTGGQLMHSFVFTAIWSLLVLVDVRRTFPAHQIESLIFESQMFPLIYIIM